MNARQWVIYCGDNDWGSDTMAALAREQFAADPTLDIVEVYEHGGWWLAWNRDMVCVGTANDMACLSAEARAFLKKFADRKIVGYQRRPEPAIKYPSYYPCIAVAQVA